MFGYWRKICIEGYCFIDFEYNIKHSRNNYLMVEKDGGEPDFVPTPNKEFDPDVKIPDFPSYCKKEICYTCLKNDCPYFAYTEYLEYNDGDENE